MDMAVSKAHQEAVQRYNKKAYDDVRVRVPKGYLDEILKPAAERVGESVNAFVQEAIKRRIESGD